MKQTANLRLALSLAAAITAAAIHQVTADDQEPKSATNGSPAATQSPVKGKKRDTYPFRGVIAKVDAETKVVTLEGKQTRRLIQVLETTRLEKSGRPAFFADLKTGENVGGTLRKTPEGKEEALLIRMGVKAIPPDEDPLDAVAPNSNLEAKN